MAAPRLALIGLLAAACAGASEQEPGVGPIVIPFASQPADSPIDELYRGVLDQCREALRAKDPERLGELVERYDRPDAPAWTRDSFTGFRAALQGLQFTRTGVRVAALTTAIDEGVAGTTFPLELKVVSGWDEPVVFQARDGERRSTLALTVEIADADAFGDVAVERQRSSLALEQNLSLAPHGSDVLAMPFPTDVAQSAAIRRIRFSGELYIARATSAGQSLALHRLPLESVSIRVFPRGYESIKRAPLTTLIRAMQSGKPEHAVHAALACEFLDARDRRQAGDCIVAALRTAGPEQTRVPLACLRRLFGEPMRQTMGRQQPVIERDDWLAWWQQNRERY